MTTRMSAYSLIIPATPPSLNEYKRWHWARQERERLNWQAMIWALLNQKGNKAPKGLEKVEVRAVLYFTTTRRRDSDNFGAVLAKWTQDCLVDYGMIPDDTADRCTFLPPMIERGQTVYTFLTLRGM